MGRGPSVRSDLRVIAMSIEETKLVIKQRTRTSCKKLGAAGEMVHERAKLNFPKRWTSG
jgi:hypothetical protein